MKFALMSMYNQGFEPLGRYCGLGKVEYCNRHSYNCIIKTSDFEKDRHIYWNRVKFLIQYLPKYDWIFWCDADAIIMNQTIKLENLIDDDADLVISRDFNDINNGVFLIKNTQRSLDFLKEIWTWRSDKNIAANLRCFRGGDQAAMITFHRNHPDKLKTKFVPQRTFNSYLLEHYRTGLPVDYANSQYQYGDFVMHMPGLGDGLRFSIFDEYRNKVIADDGEAAERASIYDAVAGKKFWYHRIGHDRRVMSFNADGGIDGNEKTIEKIWCLKRFNGEVFLFIMGKTGSSSFGDIAYLYKKADKWSGKWCVFEKMPVELISIG
jgi:mannan polymerase II complex MNN10 subunit